MGCNEDDADNQGGRYIWLILMGQTNLKWQNTVVIRLVGYWAKENIDISYVIAENP